MTSKLLSGPAGYGPVSPWSPYGAIAATVLVLYTSTVLAVAMTLATLAATEALLVNPVVIAGAVIGWQALIVFFTLLIASWYGGARPDVLSLKGFPSLSTLALAILGGMLLTLPFDIAGLTVARQTMKADTFLFVPLVNSSVWPAFALAIVVGAPLSEELLFRGYLQSALAKSGIGFIGASLLTTVGWTLLHVQYSLLGLAQVFVIGLYLSWLLWRSGTLWLPILVHAAYNALSFTLLKTGVIGS